MRRITIIIYELSMIIKNFILIINPCYSKCIKENIKLYQLNLIDKYLKNI